MLVRQGALAPGSKNQATRSGFRSATLAAALFAAVLALSAAFGTAKAHPAGGNAKAPITTEAQPVAGRGFPPLFGSREVRLSNIGLLAKWTGAFNRAFAEALGTRAPCMLVSPGRCIGGTDWGRFLASLAGKARDVQIEAVNRYVNQVPYLPDLLNYGARDHWATPVELFARGGDCEDYAIAKFVALRALGFSNSRLRLVVVQDLKRRRPHAVLAVNVNDRALVLDNQLPWIVPAEALGPYRPFYSVNEENLWRHPA